MKWLANPEILPIKSKRYTKPYLHHLQVNTANMDIMLFLRIIHVIYDEMCIDDMTKTL